MKGPGITGTMRKKGGMVHCINWHQIQTLANGSAAQVIKDLRWTRFEDIWQRDGEEMRVRATQKMTRMWEYIPPCESHQKGPNCREGSLMNYLKHEKVSIKI